MDTPENYKPMIIQPNAVTSARYEYSQMQKDFMYHFIEKMNVHMTKDFATAKDLFGNVIIEMDLRSIVKSDNYTPMLDAIRDLMKKQISYNYNRENATYEVTTTLISGIVHKKGSGRIKLTTSELSLPVISYIGSGFTAFNKSIAISLPSYYAKRMYEICCRWKDKGFYRTSIAEFRKMMMCEDKFKNNSDLDKNVLRLSEKILTEQADITFTYSFRKENKSKAFNWLELNIISSSGEQTDKGVFYNALYNILYQVYRDSRAMFICDFITEKGELKRAAERFKRLYQDINSGRIRAHGINAYVNSVLINEYGVTNDMLASAEMKKKRKKAEEKIEAMRRNQEKAALKKEEEMSIAEITGNLFTINDTGRAEETQSLADVIRNRGKKG
jgi:hypothetical protein